MPLIGTAGHVDHGKSTLIQRLTGRDPDRWEEEKRRGLTIDLGFAWMSLPDGTEVSFVDVPGHERYLKNMLAGIEAIDIALFVVAADEGWMPQSEEHLAVLDLLGVRAGLIALTKTDLVDEDLVELATLEVAESLAGTSLEGAQIVPVSATNGSGIDLLIESLTGLAAEAPDRDRGRPRLWVDRSFTASGAGTVVTGSLLDGSLAVDDPVVVYPGGGEARVRAIQVHERPTERARPGRRVALNLSGVDHSAVARGDLIGRPGDWEVSSRIAVSLHPARYVEDLDRKGAYQAHIGSAVDRVEVTGLDDDVAILRLARALPVAVGDRFILRDTGRKLVVAGGRVLDPAPGKTTRSLVSSRAVDPDSSPDDIATTLLGLRGIDSAGRLARHTAGGRASGKSAGGWAVSFEEASRLTERARTRVEREHAEHPLRAGVPVATLAGHLGTPQEVIEMIIEDSPELTRRGPDVSLAGREIEVPPEADSEWQRARARLEESLAVPTVDELGLDPELLHLRIRTGELIRVSRDLVFLPAQIERMREIIGSLPEDFTVADFRDAAGLSRKYAVPILEWTDRESITFRRGDTRRAR